MKKLRVWAEGARAYLRGDCFAMTPYPPPGPTYLGLTLESWKGNAWAAGYWWAKKHRPLTH